MTKQKKEIQIKLEEQEKKIEEYTNSLKRLQADFENYMKRSEKEKQEFVNYSNHKLLSKLLTVADSFDKAIDALEGDSAKGVNMIKSEFYKILESEGVKVIKTKGEKLDPFKHEVIDIINGKEDDLVVEELQPGYMLNNKVLRAAKVRISKEGDENV